MTNDGIRSGRRAAQGRPDALEEELLRRLGLGIDTTPEQLEATHEAVVAFLAQAPRSLRAWARANAAAADEAYALLLDPVALARSAAAAERSPVAPPQRAEPTEPPAPAGTPDARQRRGRRAPRDRVPAAVPAPDDELDELIAEVTPSAHRDEVAHPDPASRFPTRRPRGGVGRMSVGVAALAAVVVIGFVVYHAGAPDTLAASGATPSAVPSSTLDQAQVAALMEKIKANPNDTDALMGLGDAFFQAGQYSVAADWLAKLVTIDPKNQRALLALGAAEFNDGNAKDAETHWKQVLALDTKSVEAHYDLGFLYLQQQPPDLAGVKREWQRVVELAPGTEVAQNVQAHLDAIASQDPSGSPSASASPAVSASPAASQP